MRLSCEYNTKEIPVTYNMMFVSLIKEALKGVNKDYFEKLYLYNGKHNKKIKNFTFSVFLKDFEMNGNILKINDKIIFNISTLDYEFGINIYNGLLNLKKFKYKDFKLEKIKISISREKQIFEDGIEFSTLSPIYVKDFNNNPLSPKDSNFNKELNFITDISLKSFRGYGLKKEIIFEDISMKKRIVKEEISGFKVTTNKEIMFINSYHGAFRLFGDIEDLRDLYILGIGFRRSQGFGMIEVI